MGDGMITMIVTVMTIGAVYGSNWLARTINAQEARRTSRRAWQLEKKGKRRA